MNMIGMKNVNNVKFIFTLINYQINVLLMLKKLKIVYLIIMILIIMLNVKFVKKISFYH